MSPMLFAQTNLGLKMCVNSSTINHYPFSLFPCSKSFAVAWIIDIIHLLFSFSSSLSLPPLNYDSFEFETSASSFLALFRKTWQECTRHFWCLFGYFLSLETLSCTSLLTQHGWKKIRLLFKCYCYIILISIFNVEYGTHNI